MAATVTATFTDADAARQAALELERHGVEANNIKVETATAPPTNRDVGVADVEMTADVAGRYAIGGVIGAVVGAAVAIAVVLVIQPDQLALALVIAGLGGAIPGFWLGGFWGGGTKLPVDTESYDTYRPDAIGATLVVAVADLSAADEVRSMVEDLDPTGV
jgi:uncharacterized membrane protein YeaQ/YmgE (transglycosylase-associated protein family)